MIDTTTTGDGAQQATPPAESTPVARKPLPRRHTHQRPMIRQTLTLCVPWEDGDDITLEIIGLPSGGGYPYTPLPGETTRSPLDKHELHVLQEAGWDEYEGAGVTLFVRFIR